MIVKLRMKKLSSLAVVLILLASATFPLFLISSTPLETTQEEVKNQGDTVRSASAHPYPYTNGKPYDVHMYIQPGHVMNTVKPTMTPPPDNNVQNISYQLSEPFNTDLYVEGFGSPAQDGLKGFYLTLNINLTGNVSTNTSSVYYPASIYKPTEVAISIYQDNTEIAKSVKVYTLGNTEWFIPFIDTTKKDHTFNKGSNLFIRIITDNPVNITYKETEKAENANLLLVAAPIALTAETEHVGGQLEYYIQKFKFKNTLKGIPTDYHPNWPAALKFVYTAGVITDAFGTYDIVTTELTIKDFNEEIVDGQLRRTSSLSKGSLSAGYTYSWDYSQLVPKPGYYTVEVVVRDIQGHNYTWYTRFMIMEYGVYITRTDKEREDVGVGESRIHTLVLYNSGYYTDTITVRATTKPYWNAELGSTGFNPAPSQIFVNMEPGAIKNLTINITSQKNASANDSARTEVDARGTHDNIHQVDITTTITPLYNVELRLNSRQTVNANLGEEAIFNLTVTNTGIQDDVISVIFDRRPPDWDVKLAKSISLYKKETKLSFFLKRDESADFELIVTTSEDPENENNIYDIMVTARSQGDSSKARSRTVTTNRVIGVDLGFTGTNQTQIAKRTGDKPYVYDTLEYQMVVANTDTSLAHDYNITVYDYPENWQVSFNKTRPVSKIFVYNLEKRTGTQTFTVYVKPPSNVIAGTYNNIVIKAETMYYPNRYIKKKPVVTVEQFGDVTLETILPNQGIALKETTTYDVTITNTGNGVDSFVVSITTPPKWKALIDGEFPSTFVKDLNPWEFKTLKLVVTAPDDGRHGDQGRITLVADPTTKNATPYSLTTVSTVQKTLFWRIVDAIIDLWFIFAFLAGLFLVFMYVRHWRGIWQLPLESRIRVLPKKPTLPPKIEPGKSLQIPTSPPKIEPGKTIQKPTTSGVIVSGVPVKKVKGTADEFEGERSPTGTGGTSK
jgi:uncharacterized membrane protein